MRMYSERKGATLAPMVALALAALACSPAALTGGSAESEPAPPPEEEVEEPTQEPVAAPEESAVETEPETAPGDIPEFEVAVEGYDHIQLGTLAEYEHYPPSSGEHYSQQGIAPIDWGMYAEAIPPEVWVHNLEHSGIVVLYNCGSPCPDLEDDLFSWADGAPLSKWGNVKILITPNTQIESQIVALAWGWQMDLEEFDPDTLTEFYNRHLDQGPEDLP